MRAVNADYVPREELGEVIIQDIRTAIERGLLKLNREKIKGLYADNGLPEPTDEFIAHTFGIQE